MSLRTIFLLITISLLMVWLPYLIAGPTSVLYFANDPDITYIAQAVHLLHTKYVIYFDHPGTPTISLHALLLAPIYILKKIVPGFDFDFFFVSNFTSILLFFRVLHSVIHSLACGLFALVGFKLTNSRIAFWVFGLFLLASPSSTHIPLQTGPEAVSALIVALYFYLFINLKIFSRSKVLWLGALAGLAIANKLSNLPLFVAFFFLPFLKLTWLAGIVLGFLIGTFPGRGGYEYLFSWVTRLFTTQGIQGSGPSGTFDFVLYFKTMLSQQISFFFILPILLIAIAGIVRTKDWGQRLAGTFLILIYFGFCKYPSAYYLNIALMCLLYYATKFTKIPTQIWVLSLLLSIFSASKNLYFSYDQKRARGEEEYLAREFLNSKNNSGDQVSVVFGNLFTRGFALSWSNSSTLGILEKSLDKLPVRPYQLHWGYEGAYTPPLTFLPFTQFKWKYLIISKDDLDKINSKHAMDGISVNTTPLSSNVFVVERVE